MFELIKFMNFRWKQGPAIWISAMFLICLPEFVEAHEHKKPAHKVKNEGRGTQDGLQVVNAWVRAAPPGARNGAAYATIINHGLRSDALIAASTSAADKTELHMHKIDEGVMKMRQISAVNIPGQGSAKLQPGGGHMMLIGLKRSLKIGDHIMLQLKFRSLYETTVKVEVMEKGANDKTKHSH